MVDEPTASHSTVRQAPCRLYPRVLGAAWDRLDPAVQRVHTDAALTQAEGVLRVRRARGRLIGLILDIARVPPASDGIAMRLTIERRGTAERWCRAFGRCRLVTVQTATPDGLLAERIGILAFRFRLAVEDGAMLFRQHSVVVCLGPLRVSLPRCLAPRVAGREGVTAEADRTTVEVCVMVPVGRLLFSYHGTVRWRTGQRSVETASC